MKRHLPKVQRAKWKVQNEKWKWKVKGAKLQEHTNFQKWKVREQSGKYKVQREKWEDKKLSEKCKSDEKTPPAKSAERLGFQGVADGNIPDLK